MSDPLTDDQSGEASALAQQVANAYIAQAGLTDLHPSSEDIYIVRVSDPQRPEVKAVKFGIKAGGDVFLRPDGVFWHVDMMLVLDKVGIASLPTLLDVDCGLGGAAYVFEFKQTEIAVIKQAIAALPIRRKQVAA